MDVTQLVRQATPVEYSTLARGHIYGGENHPKAAPTTFTERVWVILPEGSSEHLYGPCKWLAGHGTTKPQPGSECVVGFDEQNQPTLVWWDGVQAEPTASGTAGGDLTGSYPNPTIKALAVTEPKLAAAVTAKLLNPGEPSALAATTTGAEHEISASKHASLNLTFVVASEAAAAAAGVLVNKVQTAVLQTVKAVGEQALPLTGLVVPAGMKYEVKVFGGAFKEVKESHSFLN